MANFFTNLIAHVESFFVNAWNAISHANAATITADVANDAHLVSSGLLAVLKTISAVAGVDTTKAQAEINAVVAGLETVVAGVETNLAKPVLAQVAADWTIAQDAIAPVLHDLPAVVQSVLTAVTTLLPYITAAAGLVSAEEGKASVATGMSADEARVILAA